MNITGRVGLKYNTILDPLPRWYASCQTKYEFFITGSLCSKQDLVRASAFPSRMHQRIQIQEEYALGPEEDGGGQQCDGDQGIEGEDVVERHP